MTTNPPPPSSSDDHGAAPAGTDDPAPPVDRRARPDRRRAEDRRQRDVPVAVERRSGGDRRHQPDRRDPSKRAGTYDLDADTLEFIAAVNRFKAESGKAFPTWSEVMEIVRALGYEKRGGA